MIVFSMYDMCVWFIFVVGIVS